MSSELAAVRPEWMAHCAAVVETSARYFKRTSVNTSWTAAGILSMPLSLIIWAADILDRSCANLALILWVYVCVF
jgi:hypothetical protein